MFTSSSIYQDEFCCTVKGTKYQETFCNVVPMLSCTQGSTLQVSNSGDAGLEDINVFQHRDNEMVAKRDKRRYLDCKLSKVPPSLSYITFITTCLVITAVPSVSIGSVFYATAVNLTKITTMKHFKQKRGLPNWGLRTVKAHNPLPPPPKKKENQHFVFIQYFFSEISYFYEC